MPGDPPSDQDQDEQDTKPVEVDPTGRYVRYREVLGKGAFKTVYKGFDELEGIEVAWNQVKVADVLRNVDDLERLYSEVHLLKTLNHKNIIKLYTSWVDTRRDNINFITEVFSSGTLRQYRKRHKHVDLRAVKNWSRQILSGLDYLHSHDPPVIHRDLKCDNVFINGNLGEVKIGDLGLAAILHHAHAAHSVIGTPEFMAPELYEEEYNELVDIYAFGMCLLELVMFEYPYAECINAAQIYKRVTSGIKPASLGKVQDPGVRQFIEKCIAHVSDRLSARQLLMDSFLKPDGDSSLSLVPTYSDADIAGPSNMGDTAVPSINNRDFTVEGERKEINTIFLKLRIADSTGQIRNIHFPFNIEADTSISVATEMVAELDLTDQDVTNIAAMIDAEIRVYIPDWMQQEPVGANHHGDSNHHDSEAEVEVTALPNETENPSGALVLERLPSGRKYWSDSPRGTCHGSPSGPTQLNESSELNLHVSDNLTAGADEVDTVNQDDEKPSCSRLKYSSNQDKDLSPCSDVRRDNFQNLDPSPSFISQNSPPKDVAYQAQNAISKGSEVVICGCENDVESSCATFLENESKDVNLIAQKLEKLLIEQQKEFRQLKKQHYGAILEILNELHPELRNKILESCQSRVYVYSINHQDE